MTRRLLVSAAFLICSGAPVLAGSVLQPGSTAGLAPGKPLAEGIYFVDTSSFGRRDGTSGVTSVNLPSFVWASPFTFSDTRVQFAVLQPVVATIGRRPLDVAYANSTLGAVQLAHDLGRGFGISYMAGNRAPMASALAFRSASFEQRGAISYTADGWNASANVINGLFYDNTYADWLNVDLTLTRKFAGFEIGGVAFGSTDLSKPATSARSQAQIAAGGLIGYNFGRFILQAYGTTDIATRGYSGKDTRGWLRAIVPLYKGPALADTGAIRERF